MDFEWFEAGSFLVSGGKAPGRHDGLLPTCIATVSTCIVESYPDSWALPWVETTPDEVRQVLESLSLDESGFADLRSWVERAIEERALGWPNVFFTLAAAAEFKSRFLRALQGVRLLGLSIANDVAAEFVREQCPPEGHDGSGVWTKISGSVRSTLHSSSRLLGFDVLGAEQDGSFHTIACNGLEQQLSEALGIPFNASGLIPDYSSAVAACEFMNREDVGAEPIAWYPFRVDEHAPR